MQKFDDTNYWLHKIHEAREKAKHLVTDRFWDGEIGFNLEDQLVARNLFVDFDSFTTLLEEELVRMQKEAAKPFWKKLFRRK